MGVKGTYGFKKDGLLAGYDTGYGLTNYYGEDIAPTFSKYYKGAQATNLWDDMLNTQSLRTHTKHFWDGYKWTENSTYTDPGVPGPYGVYLGLVFKHVSGALNSSWSNNSYGYMLRDIACTSGVTFTMSSWIYLSEDCNLTAVPAVIEGESGGESSVSGFDSSYNLNDKGTWQVTAKKAISDGNTRFIPLYPRREGVTDGSFTGFFMWAAPQVTEGSNVVPMIPTGENRGSDECLVNIATNGFLDVNSVSYDANGNIIFDGTSDNLTLGTAEVDFNFSVEIVFKADTITGDDRLMLNNQWWGPVALWLRQTNNVLYFIIGTSSSNYNSLTYNVSTNNWFHVVATRSNAYQRLYVNGLLRTQSASPPFIGSTASTNASVSSGSTFDGMIPICGIYDRIIEEIEVRERYNSLKNRFNF